MQSNKIYHAAMYLRLSQEDGDVSNATKAESNSISNQRTLITQFLENKDDIELVSTRIDDGYTGSNFDRPQFQLMIEDIKKGIIDCVIVKDLSRFGREYIDAGNYIERIFPMLGVRFISVTDGIDSINQNNTDMIVSFKNLLNDAYCRDISIKIRANLQALMKQGKYIGAFPVYGYMKDPDDVHRLVIDPEAAATVRDIYKYKISGMNNTEIARALDNRRILTPLAYKESKGENLKSPFKKNKELTWDHTTIKGILSNPIYTGMLAQGRYTTPNHKVKKCFKKPETEWIIVHGTHDAIIDTREFDLVQKIMSLDTRTSPNERKVYPLCGLVVCGDCGASMVKKDVPGSNGKVYSYYICNKNKQTRQCSSHRIPKDKLEDIILKVVQIHIANILDIKRIMEFINKVPFQELDIQELEKKKAYQTKNMEKYRQLRNSLYEDLKEGLISQADYNELFEGYKHKISELLMVIGEYDREIQDILHDRDEKYKWIDHFAEYQNIQSLTRIAAVELIDQVSVFEKNRIEVTFNFDDCYTQILDQITQLGYEVDTDEEGRIHFDKKEASIEEKI